MRTRRNGAAWLGLALGLVGVGGYFLWIGLGVAPRLQLLRDTALLNLAIVGLGLGCSAVGIRRAWSRGAVYRGRALAPLLGALNLGVAVWFLLLLFRFSVLPVAAAAPQVGQAAPDFVLTDDTGAPLQLAGLRGKNVLLVFYRGHW
jgi:hypothetical protein